MPVYVMRYPAPLGGPQPEPPTREDLLAMGFSSAQVDHHLVRQHELEVIYESFTRWVMLFGCIVCMLLPVSLGLLMYLVYSYVTEKDEDCDVPLQTWFIIVVINLVYHFNIKGRSIHREILRVLCRYDTTVQRLEPPPPRVRIYHLLIYSFIFGWHAVGIHLVQLSETCHRTSPNLFRAVHMFASFNICFTIFTTLSTFGLAHMLTSLLRRGLLPSSMLHQDRVAPAGTLEMQETVPYDPVVFDGVIQCPTCLEDFNRDSCIKKTVCGHHFHEQCLAPWLRVNRTCPICRADLAGGLEAAPSTTTLPPATIGAAAALAETTTVADFDGEVQVPPGANPAAEEVEVISFPSESRTVATTAVVANSGPGSGVVARRYEAL
mmetsp:Transcript_40998/g.87329  ORF Transcript_40998/g.87329 Transcript_40998/m.87329 type:complete len:378 (-) Transcript_40998:25-1158(-)